MFFYAISTVGQSKSDIQALMSSHSNLAIIQKFTENGNKDQLLAGNSQVPTLASLQNLRNISRRQYDLHSDAHVDIVMRSLEVDRGFIRNVTAPDFSAVLMMQEQVDVLKAWIETTKYRQAFLDATGDIVKMVEKSKVLHHVLLIQVKTADDKNSIPFNLAELLTESQKMRNITRFLEDVLDFIHEKISKRKQLFHQIVTDKSFANMGAILQAFNNMNLSEYLEVCWRIVNDGQHDLIKGLTLIRLCSSHTCKTMSDEIQRHYTDYDVTMKLKAAIGVIFDIPDFQMLLEYCKYFLFVLMTPKKGKEMSKVQEASKTLLASLSLLNIREELEDPSVQEEVAQEEPSEDQERSNAIFRNSQCFIELDRYMKTAVYDQEGKPNKCFNPTFAAIFLKNHLSYLLLWSNVLTVLRAPMQPRANNGAIENYFQLKKRLAREAILTETGQVGKIKVGRYVSFLAKHILSQVKKIEFNIPSRGRTFGTKLKIDESQLTENDVSQCTEQWKRTKARSKKSSFFGAPVSQRSASTSESSGPSQQSRSSQQSSALKSRRSYSEPDVRILGKPPRFKYHYDQKNEIQ